MGGRMQRKRIMLLTLLTLTVAAALLVTGCGKSGNKFDNQTPTIKITSYEGYYFSETDTLLAPYADSTFSFQQKIYWNANDPDGIITGFAYRVSRVHRDSQGQITSLEPIPTPMHDQIDNDGTYTPDNVIESFGNGWVMHQKPNQDDMTIWTSQKYATINFPAADEFGNPQVIESLFEVIAIDNRGAITRVDPGFVKRSEAWRGFNSTSDTPTCVVTTTKGDPAGEKVGAGLRLSFAMGDTDPFISHVPYKFEFKIVKADTLGHTLPGQESDWINTTTSANDTSIDKFLLTKYTTPPLSYDVDPGEGAVPFQKTKILARAFDMAGIVSTQVDSILFAVTPGFRPKTLVYMQRIYALGSHHYIDYADDSTSEILPYTLVGGSPRYASYFYRDLENTYTAVHNSNMKVWLRWGWRGEYGKIYTAAGGASMTDFTDNPYDKKVDTVLDRDTDKNYFSEITHFDLRMDDEPFEYGPLANDPNAHITDTDGKEWLRIPLNSAIGQTLVMAAQTSGTHKFEVRCVDLQGEADPVPAVFEYKLAAYIPPASRNGILVVDDDEDHPTYAPAAAVQAKYEAMLADYSGPKVYKKRTYLGIPGDFKIDARYRQLAPSDLQNYKLVIYHNDNPNKTGELKNENDGLCIYMNDGGNVLISHTAKLSETLTAFVKAAQKKFLGFFGVHYIDPPADLLSGSIATRPFFIKAVGGAVTQGQNATYPDIDVQFSANGGEASFNPLVESRQGLSTITFFPLNLTPTYANGETAEILYRMGVKPTDYPTYPPTQAQYDQYNNKPIALRQVNQISNTVSNHCYLLGFPLSYMQTDDAKALMNQVLSELN